jgi:hypothetical protein
MAGQRLTQKTALGQQTTNGDLYMVVDTSDNTGSADGTSKQLDSKFVIQTDIVPVNLDLATNPKTIIAAPGAGFIIHPLSFTVIYTYGTSKSTVTNNTYIGYNASIATGQAGYMRDFIKNVVTDQTVIFDISPGLSGTFTGSIDDKPLVMWSSADLGGDGSVSAIVTYQIVKIA